MGEKETAGAEETERAVIKTKTKSNQSNDRMASDDGGDLDDDGAELEGGERAAWTSSNPEIRKASTSQKPRDAGQGFREGGISHQDDWHDDASKLAPDKPGKSEIAIGDPGVNGNLAVSEPGVGAATPRESN